MDKLRGADDLWVLTPRASDLREAARYAAISLPWTFNRMLKKRDSRGQQRRALNIAKGILGQEMLKRKMREVGLRAETPRKSHRVTDFFDFLVPMGSEAVKMDLKSIHYYHDYELLGRVPFSVDLLLQHAGYPGPDWRTFFPMMVPHTQINQAKQAYCFAIARSLDVRVDVSTDRMDYALTAFPSRSSRAISQFQKALSGTRGGPEGIQYLSCVQTRSPLFQECDNGSLRGVGWRIGH